MHGFLEFSDPPPHYTYPLTFPIKDWPRRNDPSFIGIFFSKCRIGSIPPTDVDQRQPGVYFRYVECTLSLTEPQHILAKNHCEFMGLNLFTCSAWVCRKISHLHLDVWWIHWFLMCHNHHILHLHRGLWVNFWWAWPSVTRLSISTRIIYKVTSFTCLWVGGWNIVEKNGNQKSEMEARSIRNCGGNFEKKMTQFQI